MSSPALTFAADPRRRFEELSRRWAEETEFLSSVEQLAMHPAYQQIIGLGPVAVPLIMERLQEAPGHWFWALRAITGEDAVPESHRGDVGAMAVDWLSWGRRHGL